MPVGLPAPQVISLETEDGIHLEAWYYPGTNGRAVVALGGTGGALGDQLPPTGFLLDAGYGVMQVGSRACAREPVTVGAKEMLDAQAAIRFLAAQPEVETGSITLFGFSMGAAAAIRAAARTPEVGAVIAEGGYFNLGEDFVEPGARKAPFETFFLYTLAGTYWLRTGVNPWQVSPVEDIEAIGPRPILLIYGEREAASGRADLQFEAAGRSGQLWIVPEGDHGTNYLVAGEIYERRVLDFLLRP